MTKPIASGFLTTLRSRIASDMAVRRATMPHVVPQPRLLQSEVRDAYFAMIAERRRWIAENCVGEFMLDELLDANGVEIGRAFRFSDYNSAFHFRMRF
jgi:hypothetical protein